MIKFQSPPAQADVVFDNNKVTNPWLNWFQQITNSLSNGYTGTITISGHTITVLNGKITGAT